MSFHDKTFGMSDQAINRISTIVSAISEGAAPKGHPIEITTPDSKEDKANRDKKNREAIAAHLTKHGLPTKADDVHKHTETETHTRYKVIQKPIEKDGKKYATTEHYHRHVLDNANKDAHRVDVGKNRDVWHYHIDHNPTDDKYKEKNPHHHITSVFVRNKPEKDTSQTGKSKLEVIQTAKKIENQKKRANAQAEWDRMHKDKDS